MVTKTFDLLQLAKRNGINISLNNGELQLRISKGNRINPQLLQEIKDNKQLITEFLNSSRWKSRKVEAFENELQPFDRSVVQHIPLSFSQERLWFIDQLEGSVAYHIPAVLRLSGNLDRDALIYALQTIVKRHEVLRSVMQEQNGLGYQYVMQEDAWQLAFSEAAYLKKDPEALQRNIQKLVVEPFDLSRDYMLRANLLQLSGEEHILVVTVHHIASDGWSLSIIVKEVVELYNAFVEKRSSTLQQLPLQYADYAYWQRTWFRDEMLDSRVRYWKGKLDGVLPLELPTDFERPAIQSMEGATTGFTIDNELTARLAGLCQQQQTTLFMMLMAVCQVLMYRYSGQTDVCMGTPIANRPYQEVEELIGFFVNTLAIRSDLSNNIPFTELLQQVRETTFEAYEHQEVPFEKVVEAVMKQRDLSRHPLFQVMLIFQNTPDVPQLKLGDVQLSQPSFENHTARFDLTFNITENTQGMQVSVEYCTRLFREITINRLMGHFRQLLYAIAAAPGKGIDELTIITPDEENHLLSDVNHPVAEYGPETVISLFQQQVALTPGAAALVFKQKELTYLQLHEQSNQLARYLISKGVQKETLVPVYIDRSVEMVIAILGILKAGGAFVPIDPDYPAERTGFMLADTGASLIVTGQSVKDKLKARTGMETIVLDDCPALNEQPKTDLPVSAEANGLAYVIYTSGSTGLPKGVMVEHDGLANLLQSIRSEVAFDTSGVFLSVTTYSFDISYLELFVPLISGGKLIVVPREVAVDGFLLQQQLASHKATHMQATPSTWQLLQNSGWQNKEGIKILAGGEALPEDLKNYITAKGESWNVYGPTETTIWSAVKKLSQNKKVTIGTPIANNRIYILNKNGQLCPVGVAGEIGIGGVQVARGYLNRPELSGEKFVPDPYNPRAGATLFKTGDLGLLQEDGNIVYLGRIDDQVKISGYRIELGEIETVLQQHDSILQAVVAAKNDGQGNKRLVGYVVPHRSFTKEEIIAYLKEKLPVYMVPALWVELESLPLTPNGKINRKALPDADVSGSLEHQYVAPCNETERVLAGIWESLLLVKQVGIHDNFFELGGHSLRALQVISLIRRDLNVVLGIREFFLHPTVAQLAVFILEQKRDIGIDTIEVDEERPELIPLSFSQERLWFIDQLEGSVQYHVAAVLRMKGMLDQQALRFALQSIVGRHEILRTVIHTKDGQGYQEIMAPGGWQLEIMDGTDRPDSLKNEIRQIIRKPFDLSKDYMLRATLIRLGGQEHMLVVTMHHISSDAWSIPILIEEVAQFYKSYIHQQEVQLPKLSFQYADYSIWQRKNLQGANWEGKVAYWKQKLEGVSPLQLPTDFPKPLVRSSRGASINYLISKEILNGIHKLGNQQGATLYMTLLAAFKVMLYRYSGQQDICVGTSVANRNKLELERMVGFFVNTIAFRDEIDGEASFTDLLLQVKNTTLEGYEHQEVPFEKVVETVVKDRDPGISPVFQVMLVLRNTPNAGGLQLGEIVFSSEAFEQTSVKFDITFFVNEAPDGLHIVVEYSTDLYKEETMLRMLGHFSQLLSSAVQTPQQKIGLLPMLTSTEQQQVQEGWNKSAVSYPRDATVVSLFEQQVLRTPGATAVVSEGEQLTFEQLNRKANQLAHYLRQKGVKEDELVPLFIERSIDMLTAMLGILKAGAAYVPIDTDFPEDRIRYMLQDTAASLVISNSNSAAKLPATATIEIVEADDWTVLSLQSKDNVPAPPPAPGNIAYVIYTSGSTGRPKGVMIEHRHLVDYVFGLDQQVQVSRCSSYALVSTIATDLGNTVIFSSLLLGGALHLFSKNTVSNAAALQRYFQEHTIDCLKIVPSHWKALSLGEEKLLLPARLLVFGGEALPAEQIAAIQATGSACVVVNHYGPTETTIGKLLHVVDGNKKYNGIVPVGRPFSNTQVYVLSKEMQLCPVGVAGQLYIGGDGVARGYLNQAELTNEKFVPNPFTNTKEKKSQLYATGDRVKWLEDGNISFIGRADNQVKIRGYRVEPGEVESMLQQSELVKGAAVLVNGDSQDNKRLVGYIVPQGYFDREGIIEYLQEKLPEYMIPALLVELEVMPLTPNGKIDRQALSHPDASAQLGDKYVAPRNEAEQQLVSIWEEVLEVEGVGVHDNFFELGGHSLLAVRLISAVRKGFGMEVSIGAVFDYPTIAELAEQLRQPGEAAAEALPAITVVQPRPVHIPLSFSQERLWFIDQMDGSLQYHVPAVLRLRGDLQRDTLQKSFSTIVNRHEVLRTIILDEQGQGYQHIKEKDRWQLTFVDGSAFKEDITGLQQYIRQLISAPFNLSADDMLRATLISLSSKEHVLVATLHHIASDGWSASIMVKELAELYNSIVESREAGLARLPVQYADYAMWQRKYLQGETWEKKLVYWKEKLEGAAVLQLPTDYNRPTVLSNKGATIGFTVDTELSDQLQSFSQQQGTTLFMTILAAFKILLHRYSGQEDICVGTPIAGRQQSELEGLIGFFVNTLVLRTAVSGSTTFYELLKEVRTTTLEAYAHQEVPFEKVVDLVVKERDLSRSPLFQVMLALQNTPEIESLRLNNLEVSREGMGPSGHHTSKFDLTFVVIETAQGLNISVEYGTDLFTEATIRQMAAHFRNLLQAVVSQPHQSIGTLPMLSDVEKQHLLVELNNTQMPFPAGQTVVALFEQQAERVPQNIAVVFKDQQLSYSELNKRANRLAHYLQSRGVQKEKPVPVCINRSIELLVAMLGILKAGGAYVPIDPAYPADRIGFMLKDTGATLLLAGKETEMQLPSIPGIDVIRTDDLALLKDRSEVNLSTGIVPGQLAYIIYTSGSTGRPKGVMIEHKNLSNLVNWHNHAYEVTEASRATAMAGVGFDAFGWEIWPYLSCGASLYIVEDRLRLDPPGLVALFIANQISHSFAATALVQDLVKAGKNNIISLQYLLTGGDKLSYIDTRKFSYKLINNYGPTENTVVTTNYTLSENDSHLVPPIGKPISNTVVYILNQQEQLVPVGVAGELCIGGASLARGYLNRPELMKEKFITDPFTTIPGSGLYKSGDLCRWLPDGNLVYLGRIDEQVKIRGYRVELGEIERVLQECTGVDQAVVLAKEDIDGHKKLVGYIAGNDLFDREDVLAYLRGKLPEYMIPAVWVQMDQFPLTANGKINRQALPDADMSSNLGQEYVAPGSETEKVLAEIWQELLGVERVGIYDNFFELGGHSLMAMRMVAHIENRLSVSVPIKVLFQFTCINDLSKYVELQFPDLPKETITAFKLYDV